MKLPSIFKNKDIKQPVLQWAPCKQPKTQSFRAGDDMFRTTNCVYFDPSALDASGETTHQESWFTNSSSQSTSSYDTYSCADGGEAGGSDESVERIVREARSERLFFEPGSDNTSSILKVGAKTKVNSNAFLKESVVLAMESEDPYLDFKSSMQEMVETHALKDWESLEELLGWYLKMNGKMNHGFIVGAFVDLLIGLSFSSSSCCSEHDQSFMSASSSFASLPSPPLSPAANRENGEQGQSMEEKSYTS